MRNESEAKCLIITFYPKKQNDKKINKTEVPFLVGTSLWLTGFVKNKKTDDLFVPSKHYLCTDMNLVRLCFAAGQRRSQSSPAGHPASLYQLARLRSAILTHRHAEIPQEGQSCQSILRWTYCCALQVKCAVKRKPEEGIWAQLYKSGVSWCISLLGCRKDFFSAHSYE